MQNPVVRPMRWMRAVLWCIALALAWAGAAWGQSGTRIAFDHQVTGFPLTGQHEEQRCETCHLKGIFKGTPKDCAGCHVTNNPRGALAQPTRHIQTIQACDSCHTTTTFTGARFDHVGVQPGSCISCHTGVRATGKPSGHIVTNASCDQCHGVLSFAGANAQPANHIPVAFGVSCNACHVAGSSFSVMPSLSAIHANAPSTASGCASCHGAAADSFALPNGFRVVGMPGNHVPTTAPCERCHTGSGTRIASLPVGAGASFAGAQMSHQGISSACETCHARSDRAVSFAGIDRIVGMPATTPAGPSAHIPTSAPCENCHLASLPAGLVPASAAKSPPGTGFASPPPSSAQIHAGVTSGCSNCHETGQVWLGIGLYPATPNVLTAGASYNGFQTRPRAVASSTSVADPNHPSNGDCATCHGSTSAFSGVDKPANHIPYAPGVACTACHIGGNYSVTPSLTAIHANSPNPNGGCTQCHGAAADSFAIPATGFKVLGQPANHIPTSAACENCHVGPGAGVAALPVGDGARFSNGLMNHKGITNGCVACHQAAGSASSFAGISRIVGMPPTSPAGPNSHIPSSTACESCHLASLPKDQIDASATLSPPGTGFATPAPTGAQIHAGITGGCSSCHETGQVWLGVGAYPISPTTLSPGALYQGFQTRPRAAAGTYNVADPAHPSSGDCSACHGSTAAFSAIDKPANHIPYSASASCDACHTSSDYAVTPTLAAIHANAQSTSGNCAQCHGANAASFAIPAVGFSIVGLPSNHLPTTASCEACHVGAGSSVPTLPVPNGAKFSGSTMSHAGISSGCASCHLPAGQTASFAGVSSIVGMPATSPAGANSHIPSSSKCENCHLGSLPGGTLPASASKTAPGTAFASPAPTGVQIHTGITSGCSACHDTGMVWMGVTTYPISPTIKTAGASYTGFQTRPKASAGSFNVADAAHPSSGDCSVCHSSTTAFSAVDKPANHIPYAASATCTSCHTSTDYSLMPTLAAIHANAPSTTGNCAQCHGAAAASFAIPSANFAIVGQPGNHIPTSAACETCHVGSGSSIAALPVPNGARFSGSTMSHSGITSNCSACHLPAGQTANFAGIAALVGMPPTSPAGTGSHIPSSSTCEACHLGSTPSGPVPASATKAAPGTAFATPAPSGPQIHAGVTAGCSSCHDTGMVWMGVTAYPITPTTLTPGASYKGFQTRPKAAAGSFNVADAAHPSSRDCADCHSSTTAFTAIDKPANHIPYASSASCTACHTSGDFSVTPTLAAIHANAQSTTGNCAQCHGAAAPSFAIASTGFTIVGLPGNHMPTTASCEVCHVGNGSSVPTLPVPNGARFSSSLMSHSGITKDCVSCHAPAGQAGNYVGIGAIVGMPRTTPVGSSSHIPSSTVCESCHLASTPAGLIAPSASKLPPGTGFATPAPTGAQIHAGVTSGCSGCHESSYVWLGMNAYPISPTILTPGASYNGFQTRPRAAAGSFNVADAAHPNNGDCSACHGSTTAFTAIDKPSNHIPYAANASCSSCHTSSDFSVMPTLAAIHANAQSTTSNCAQCHGASAASFAIPAANFSIVGLPGNHLPTTAACELCHVGSGSSVPTLPVPNGAKFSGSKMSHSGITKGCVSCHVPSGTPTNFAGITSIVGMPVTSPAGANAHIPSSTTCESCHLATTPAGLIAANATKTAPGTLFASPAPTGPQIHAGVTSGCSACHDTGMVWMGVSSYPISPSVLTAGANYVGFQTRPKTAAGTYNVADAAHPTTGDCVACHSSTTAFTAVDKPANHIPYANGANCGACHTSSDFSVMPTLAAIHANAQSTTSNCSQCHGSSAASFAIPAANFSIVGLPGNHLPTTASCEVCHVGSGSSVPTLPVPNGAKFSGSKFSHSGITTGCVSCHVPSGTPTNFAGITSIVGMPVTSPAGANSHIPSSTTCESCHLGTTPAGLIAANATKTAPGTLFASPAPTGPQIHAGITSGCSTCHDTGMVWMGVSAYPISPTVVTAGASYNGFQTRPKAAAGTYNVADSGHPATGDCSVCHGSTTAFTAVDKPANHIPYAATATCTSCHTGSDFSVMPTLAAIHANAQSTTSNCAQCHGSSAASFAIPAANFSIVGLPGNHLPTTAACELCHVGSGSSVPALPVPNGAKFSGSKFSHSGITNGCVSCHVTSGTPANFAGITSIVGMPPTSPAGANSHIPSSSTCESCHLATTPAGLIAANATKTAPGTLFASPAPTGPQIHAGVTSGCSACHDTGMVWMGVSSYPIAPTSVTPGASYTGFQTRPKAAAGTYNVADSGHPSSGDCSSCHSSTTAFSGVDKPANHIPYAANATCTACHTSTDYAVQPTIAAVHANLQSQTSNCAQCHGSAAPSFAIPSAAFSIVGLPANHLPTTTSCEACHVGSGSSVPTLPVPNGAKFSGSAMNHAGITTGCVSCHVTAGTPSAFTGIASIIGMPPTSPSGANAHIPSSTACESCHLGTTPVGLIPASATKTAPGTLFATPAPTGPQIHAGITSGCSACHDTGMVWMGVSAYPISPTVVTAGASYKGFQTRPRTTASSYNVADSGHPTAGDCSTCHNSTTAFTAIDKPANHIPYAATAACTACHTSSDYAVMPTLAAIHANAQSTTSNCSQCHGSSAASFAIPAANFSIVGLPGNHLPTAASCEVCHVGSGSSVPTLPVPNGAKFSGSKFSHSGITTGCVSCHVPSGTPTNFAGITSIVGMPVTSPAGANSHIPSSTTCESCHLGTTPAGLIAANATKTAPGTLFATPAPTGPQIHAGITSGCSTCHDTGMVWMGVSAYPISPTVLTAGANYNGFQTRPKAAAGTYNVADSGHPATGDCSVCHSSTTAFTAVDKPANHIPYAATATCTACHTSSDYAVMPTLAAIHANAQSTTSNCAQCHGSSAASYAIPSANFSIVGLPGNHLPTTAACELCHVGSGSSVPTLPVPNGAKFSGSKFSHSGITNGCVSCHVPSGTPTNFAGITSIVGMPVTSPAGANSHIPSSTTCESCHLGTTPAGQIAANATKTAPGTLFASPAPTGPQIHAGITSGCSTCHDTGMVWMGVSAYPISPTTITQGANYTGFQTRPKAAAGTYNVADAAHPASGDCSGCHSGTTYFSGAVMPAGHIPTPISSCSTCHIVAGDFSIAGLTTSMATLHTGITSGCRSCHVAGAGAGPFAGCATQAGCTTPVPLTYQPKVMPLAAGGSPTAPSTSTHIPVGTVACEACHSATNFTTFGGLNMRPPTGTAMHTAVAAQTCMSCHERPYKWYGVSIVVRDSGHTSGARAAPNDCDNSGCHRVSNQFMTLLRPVPIQRAALNGGLLRILPRDAGAATAGLPGRFDHAGVLPGQCLSCHNGQLAKAQPAKHWMARSSCDNCHRTSSWLPAQYNHRGTVMGQCQSCHNGVSAPGKPGMHFVTVRSCDSCHRTIGWRPASYQHLSPAYRPQPDKLSCVSCHITNGEVIPRQLRGGGRPGP